MDLLRYSEEFYCGAMEIRIMVWPLSCFCESDKCFNSLEKVKLRIFNGNFCFWYELFIWRYGMKVWEEIFFWANFCQFKIFKICSDFFYQNYKNFNFKFFGLFLSFKFQYFYEKFSKSHFYVISQFHYFLTLFLGHLL